MPRRYHFWLSKQMTKVSKYRTSGTTQRKGITAISWHIKLVVARSMTDATMGRRNQNSCTVLEGLPAILTSCVGTAGANCFLIPKAQAKEPVTKTRYPAHHPHA